MQRWRRRETHITYNITVKWEWDSWQNGRTFYSIMPFFFLSFTTLLIFVFCNNKKKVILLFCYFTRLNGTDEFLIYCLVTPKWIAIKERVNSKLRWLHYWPTLSLSSIGLRSRSCFYGCLVGNWRKSSPF